MALDRSIVVHHLFEPVSTLPATVTNCCQILSGNVSLPVPRGITVHYASLVHNIHILLSRQNGRNLVQILHAVVAVISNFARTCLTLLSGDQNDAVSSTRTIDSCRSCVLQNIDRLNIRGVQRRKATIGHTVHNIQRCVRTSGTHTTNINLEALIEETTIRCDVHTGGLALQCAKRIDSVHLSDILTLNLNGCTGEELLLLNTITYDNDIFNHVAVFFHHYAE